MSTSRAVLYKCPYCGKEFEVQVYDTVNADQDRDLRDRCLSGDLFRESCPHCKKDFMIQYPLIYMDEAHKFIIWLSTQEAGSQLRKVTAPLADKGYTLRRCETLQEFTEKISILEDGMNDVLVELAKFDSFIEFIDNKKGTAEDVTSIEYQRADNGVIKINVRTDDKGMSFLIPISMMENEMEENKELYEVENLDFPLVNSAWITSLFEETEPQA